MYQLSTLDQNLVTVTLYYKHKANKGTLLAQEILCPGWSEEEFHRLHDVITAVIRGINMRRSAPAEETIQTLCVCQL